MNKVLPWVKSNWLIVVLSLVILAILPTSLIISSGMNSKLRESVQKRIDEDAREIGNANLSYTIVSPIPGVPDVEHKAVANKAVIEWFKTKREAINAEASEVWTRALAFNRSNHAPLMEGIFPKPPDGADERVARNDFTRLVRERVPDALLTTIRGGPAPDALKLSELLMEQGYRRQDQMLAQNGASQLNLQEAEALGKELAQIRLDQYGRRAAEISVYADSASFTDIPAGQFRDIPGLGVCWEWQEAIWALNDFAAAIAAANTRPPGGPAGVPGSVVKRIVKVKVVEPPPRSSGGGGEEEGGSRRSRGESNGMVPLDPAASLTGRASGLDTANTLYDVRLIEAELIVATRHIPILLNALAATNFMTVIDLDLERVEPADELASGFYYGADHVVKAKMVIETLWFRDWVAPLMPAEVRRTRGVEDAPAEGEPTPPGDG